MPKAHYTDADDPKRLVDVDQKMHDAVALDEEGRTPAAIELYRQVLSRRPDMMAAARHLAFDYWRIGKTPLAIDALRAALRAGPTPGAQIQLGTYLTEVGQFPEALTLLERAAAADPTLDALNALGIAYARSDRTADALAVFARSLTIDPDNPMTHENIGAIHLDAGEAGAGARRVRAGPPLEPDVGTGSRRAGDRRVQGRRSHDRAGELETRRGARPHQLGRALQSRRPADARGPRRRGPPVPRSFCT